MTDKFESFINIVGFWALLFAAIYSISFGMIEGNDAPILIGLMMLLAFSVLLNTNLK